MKSAGHHIRVLMLGWEYPPRFAGGLGKACQGLSQAIARLGAQVFFVLPTFKERVSESHLEVVGAWECLMEAGWSPELELMFQQSVHEAPIFQTQFPRGEISGELLRRAGEGASPGVFQGSGEVKIIRSEARLFPYGGRPMGTISENMKRIMRRMGEERMAEENPPQDLSRKSESTPGFTTPIRQQNAATGGAPFFRHPSDSTVRRKASRRFAGPDIPISPPAEREIYGKNLWLEIEKFCFTVRHLTEAHEVDVVHAHDWMTFPAAFEFQRMTGVPVFLHVHATEFDRSGEELNSEVFQIERDGFRKANHIFAVSRYTAGMIERLYGVSRKKISVVYNAPEEKLEDRSELQSGLPASKQVLFLGRLTFQKGPDHFLKAAALVHEANPEARFMICGTGDMLSRLRQMAHRLGIEKQVHFAGFIAPSEVDQVLRQSRVLVMPSVSEPFGLVALEAIRCGIPVILSKQSGVREILQRALHVDFWDHHKLADQILAALRLSGLSQQLVDEGLSQVHQLSWDKSAHRVVEIYRRHLGSTFAQAIGGGHGH